MENDNDNPQSLNGEKSFEGSGAHIPKGTNETPIKEPVDNASPTPADKIVEKVTTEFEQFLLSDLPSKIFPVDRTLGYTAFREDFFETPKDVENYIEEHFKIFREELKNGNK